MNPVTSHDVVVAFATAVLAMVCAIFVSKHTVKLEAKRDARAEFRVRLQELLAIAIQYPCLEDEAFCSRWNSRDPEDERYHRYDVYCCMVFNLVEDVWKHAEGNRVVVEEIVSHEEWCAAHREWWNDNKVLNARGYDPKFYTFIADSISVAEASQPRKES